MKEVGTTRTIVFDFNDGSGDKKIWRCEKHQPIGNMPSPVRKGFVLVGWYTKPDNGKGYRVTDKMAVDKNIVLYAHWKKEMLKRNEVLYNNKKDTWINDSRNQTSILPGTPGYEEWLEDLIDDSPFEEDDAMHTELEKHNAELALKLAEKASITGETTDKRKARLQAEKRAMSAKVHAQAFRRAIATETKRDDENLSALEKSDELIYDDGVSLDSLDDVYDDMVFDK